MKKIAVILSYVLLLSGFVFAGKPTTTLCKISGGITIDGSLEDWVAAGIKPIEINKPEQVAIGKVDWLGAEKQSGKIYVAFTDNTLYIAADIKSPQGVKNNKEQGKIYDGNGIELFIGFNNSDPEREMYTESDYQIGISPGHFLKNSNTWKVKPSVFCYNLNTPVKDAKLKVKPTKTGYIIEAAIPSSAFAGWAVDDGAEIGFDVGIDDAGEKGFGRKVQLTWSGDKDGWKNPKGWGIANIKKCGK
jgi:hypothetical protein